MTGYNQNSQKRKYCFENLIFGFWVYFDIRISNLIYCGDEIRALKNSYLYWVFKDEKK
jgi:hypothetical protein